jgi:hypothetical protein
MLNMNFKAIYVLIFIAAIFAACGEDSGTPTPTFNPGPGVDPNQWLIPQEEVFDGGPGVDGIPAIDNPQFTRATDVNFLSSDDLMMVIPDGDGVKAYPIPILDWHEIVNDEVGDEKMAITYCPLTGTGIGWNRVINGQETTFGVSGLLFNTNLMPFDRLTQSTWSQQRLDCVNGSLIGTQSENFSFVEMEFSTLLDAFPDAQVMNTNTGFDRDYDRYPYNDYRTNNSRLLFPISVEDDRLLVKQRTLGVINLNGRNKVYTFNDNGAMIDAFTDNVGGEELFIIRSEELNFMVAFINDRNLTFIEGEFPFVAFDESGIKYDVLGRSVNAVDMNLELPTQFMGYWFSWGTFYPGIELE